MQVTTDYFETKYFLRQTKLASSLINVWAHSKIVMID